MLKVFYYPLPEDSSSSVKYSISSLPNGFNLSCSYVLSTGLIEKSIDIDFSEYSGCVLQIAVVDTDVPMEISVSKIFDFVDCNTFKRAYQTNKQDFTLARVIINEDASDVQVYLTLNTSFPALDNYFPLSKAGNCLTGYMKENSPFFATVVEKRKTKARMLNNVDIYSSVSYLEAQVDTLTRALISVLPSNHPLLPILNEANSHSVLDIKPTEQIISEFDSDKSKVRSLQSAYYAEKNSID